MEGQIKIPAGILSFGKNILGEQVYAIMEPVGVSSVAGSFLKLVRKATASEVEEAFKK
jgi:hypothetical protein